MDNSFLAYLQQLELIAFFSGYPLLYAIVVFAAGNQADSNNYKARAVKLLPYAYALVATLFLGFQLKKLYPDYSAAHLKLSMQHPWLVIWGLMAILFWIPALAKKKSLSLIHSLAFFFFLARDLFTQLFASSSNNDLVRNDMRIYTNSLFLNLAAFALLMLTAFLFTWYKKHAGSKS